MSPRVRDFFDQMTNASDASVIVAHVSPPRTTGTDAEPVDERYLDDAVHELHSCGSSAMHCVRTGDPVHEIISLGRQLDVDLIVMYPRPPSCRDRRLHGSVTEGVLEAPTGLSSL